MASHERIRRVSEQIRRELVSILPQAVRHEKITFASVTGIDLSRDFKYATVYMTVIGDADLQKTLIALLNEHQGKIRHLLSQRLQIRTVPLMKFKYDESIAYGARMEGLLTDLVKNDQEKKPRAVDEPDVDADADAHGFDENTAEKSAQKNANNENNNK